MAEFLKETATVQRVYLRRYLPGEREKYTRQPYNLVTYDDNNQYAEPIDCAFGAFQFFDIMPESINATALITDVHPFAGVTEFK